MRDDGAVSPQAKPSIWIGGLLLGLVVLAMSILWFLHLPAVISRAQLKARLKSVGEMTTLSDLVESRFTQAPEFAPIAKGKAAAEKILAGETVRTDGTGRAEILLDSGESFELSENSRALFEIDPEGLTRVSLLAGGVDLKSSLRSRVVFLRDGRIVSEAELLVPRSHVVVAAKKFDAGVVIPTKAVGTEDGNAALKQADAPSSDTDLSTLSQDEILRSLQAQGPLFRKCYLNLLQETGNRVAKVNALVAFEIQANGKLNNVRVWHSSVQSHIFLECLSETFERTHFRAFQGEPIRIDEFPLAFE